MDFTTKPDEIQVFKTQETQETLEHHETNTKLEYLDNLDNLEQTNQKTQTQPLDMVLKNKNKKKKKNRCSHCKKKIGFLNFNCKCSDKDFCSSCVQPELHNCAYNFKDDKTRLKKSLVKICNQKIIPI
jgi:hypothetical protein